MKASSKISSSTTQHWQQLHTMLAGSRDAFITQLAFAQTAQAKQLQQIISLAKNTAFGRQYAFAKIKNYNDFAAAVPLQDYEDLHPFFSQQAADPNESLICFEQTGGSTSATKQIPYTQHSLASFQRGLFPWMDDLLLHRPAIKQGSAYWSISPALRQASKTAGGHPIGLSNDALYFGQALAAHIAGTLAVTSPLSDAFAQWRDQTLQHLLLSTELRFISVWSPSFLLELLYSASNLLDKVIHKIAKINPHRARQINQAFAQSIVDTTIIWPDLDTISCWTDGLSANFLPQLQASFPHAYIQGKGLLATEGIVTIPLSSAKSPVLAIHSGFYEFLDSTQQIKRSDALEIGKEYELILTNYSGLYRYKLGDWVTVEGYYQTAPMLRFIGRSNKISDICGEKLNDVFVTKALRGIDGFAVLIPYLAARPYYWLVTSSACVNAESIEQALCKNPQYQYARTLNQLGPLRIKVVSDAMQRYSEFQRRKGQRVGDIKVLGLVTDHGVLEVMLE